MRSFSISNFFKKYGNIHYINLAYNGIQQNNQDIVLYYILIQYIDTQHKLLDPYNITSRFYTVTLEIMRIDYSPKLKTKSGQLIVNSSLTYSNFLPRVINFPLYTTNSIISSFSPTTIISTIGSASAITNYLFTPDESQYQEILYSTPKAIEYIANEIQPLPQPDTFKEVAQNYMKARSALNNPKKTITLLSALLISLILI